MSSSSYLTTIPLNLILLNLYRFGGPLLIMIGTISSIMNLIIYLQKNVRQNPSSIYIISRNISNLLFIYLSILYETLSLGYNITSSSYNLAYCRFSIYMTLLFDILNPFYLFLTIIDRILITSSNINLREQSTHRLAYILSISGLLFWILFHIHPFFLVEIIHIRSNYFYCYYQFGLYSTLITYYSLIGKGILFPLLLIVFGLRMMKNFRENTCRITSVSTLRSVQVINSYQIRTKDRAIVIILMKDIFIYLIFSSITSIVFIYELIAQQHMNNIQQKEMEYFIRYCSMFCVSIPFCIGFYTNLFISKTFREQVIKIFMSHHAQ